MIQITSYILYILVCANGKPTGYTFTYSSNQTTHSNAQEDSISGEDHTDTYQYGD